MAELRTYTSATTGTDVKPEVRGLTDGRVRVDWRTTRRTVGGFDASFTERSSRTRGSIAEFC